MNSNITLFDSAEEVWFWFIAANEARRDGAKIVANQGLYKRPCEPSDVLKICERLYRHRRLDINHFRVLRHYGLRAISPDGDRPKEVLSFRLWGEAMDILEDVFISKGIVYPRLSAEVINFQERREAMLSW